MKRTTILIAVAVLIAIGAQSLWAQQNTATLRGTVKTVDGLAVAGVMITATNTETGITWSATSDERGKYFLLTLTPGTYNIKLAKEQYKEKIYEGIVLSIGQEILLNLEIESGAFEDVIVIQGETPLIEPTKSSVSTLIAEEFIQSIPTKERSFHDLAFLAPGVVKNNKWGLGTAQSVSGMRGFSNTFILDGVSNDEAYLGSTATFVGQDTIQEFDVITHMAPAEFGQATGGIFNIATRSGTNEFHGSASTFYRDERFQEKDYFADEKAPFSRLVFSGTFGGPIIQDKAFFFFNYEGHDNDTNAVITAPVEYGVTVPNGSTFNSWFAKIDYTIDDKNMVTLRSNGYKEGGANGGVGGWDTSSCGYDWANKNFAFAGTLTSWWGDNILNEFRVSYTDNNSSADPYSSEQGVFHPLGNTGNFWAPWDENSTKLQFVYNMTYMLDDHALKMGIDYARTGVFGDSTNWSGGIWNSSSNQPFDPDDLSTYPWLYRQSLNTTTEYDIPTNAYALFVQDQWNVTDNMTLNLGLRWEYEDFWETMVGAGTVTGEPVSPDRDNFQPRIGWTWQPWENLNTTFRAGYGRFYDQVPNNELVFIYLNTVNVTGFLYVYGWSEYGTIPIYPTPPDPADYIIPGGDSNADFLDSELHFPHLDQFTFGVSHQISANTAFHADFTYAKAVDLWTISSANPPDPETGVRPYDYDATMWTQSAICESEYKGLLMRLEHRFPRGKVTLAYTLSSSYDDLNGDPHSSVVFNARNPMDGWGPGTNHVPHRLVMSGHVVLPYDFTVSGTFTYAAANCYTAQTPDDNNLDELRWEIPPGRERGDIDGDPYVSLDMRVGKAFEIGRYRLHLFFEGYNLTNTVNFTSYVTRIDYDTFEEPSAADAMREFQIGFRFDF